MSKFRFINPWIYKLDEDFVYSNRRLRGYDYQDEWISISSGSIVIRKGYAWDGCSFKFNFADVFILGVPDGRIDIHTYKPVTYHASLVHDALCQIARKGNFSYWRAANIFDDMLKEQNFAARWLYASAVKFWVILTGEK